MITSAYHSHSVALVKPRENLHKLYAIYRLQSLKLSLDHQRKNFINYSYVVLSSYDRVKSFINCLHSSMQNRKLSSHYQLNSSIGWSSLHCLNISPKSTKSLRESLVYHLFITSKLSMHIQLRSILNCSHNQEAVFIWSSFMVCLLAIYRQPRSWHRFTRFFTNLSYHQSIADCRTITWLHRLLH